MSMGGRWTNVLASAGLALGLGGCDLSGIADQIRADFEKGIQERAAEAQRQAEAQLGEAGGEVRAYSGAIAVPEGALEGDTTIAVEEVPPNMLQAELPGVLQPVAPPVAFTPHGTTFNEPVTLSLFFDKGMPTDDLSVLRLDDEQDTSWERVSDSDVMVNDGVALVSTTHFSVYTVVSCNALPGALAGVCEDFKSGDLSFKELVELAPPVEDAWSDVIPDGGTSGDGDEPGGAGLIDDCNALRDCVAAAEECQKNPRSSVCEFVEACQKVLSECGEDAPPPDEIPCNQLAAQCEKGDRLACEAHKELCPPNGHVDPPAEECEKLWDACDAGDQQACDLASEPCPRPGLSECDQLSLACESGDQRACETFGEQCEVGQRECDWLAQECDAGDEWACGAFDTHCGDDQVDCAQLGQACDAGDQEACQAAEAAGCAITPPTECWYEDRCAPETCDESGCTPGDCWQEEVCEGPGGEEPPPDECRYEEVCDEVCDGDVCWQDCWGQEICDGGTGEEPPPPPPDCWYTEICEPGGCNEDVCWDEQCHQEEVCDGGGAEPPPPDGEPADGGVAP